MVSMIRFIISIFYYKGAYFTYPPAKQALILKNFHLYFEAGKKYLALKEYEQASLCFSLCHAYRHLMYTYVKMGLYSKAIEIAEEKQYYKIGAKLCLKIHNIKKAAFFYSYFRPIYAAKLYKKEGFFYEAAQSYLKAYAFESALSCYLLCDENQKKEGIRQIEEIAITLYFVKAYQDAFTLFTALGDEASAKLCKNNISYSLINPSPLHILE
jgi:hypothetical protein